MRYENGIWDYVAIIFLFHPKIISKERIFL